MTDFASQEAVSGVQRRVAPLWDADLPAFDISEITILDYNELNLDDECVQELSNRLLFYTSLSALFLCKNRIEDCGAAAIARTVAKSRTLRRLKVCCNRIGPAGAQEIAAMLAVNSTLRVLEIRNNRLGDQGALAIVESLRIVESLQKLDIANNRIGRGSNSEPLLQRFFEPLYTNCALKSLNFGNNNLGIVGARLLASLLASNNTLQYLFVPGNNIGPEGARLIATSLIRNCTLKSMSLADNGLGCLGAEHIFYALRSNKALNCVIMENNGIKQTGAEKILGLLKQNFNVTSIDLYGNEIDTSMRIRIASVLQRNKLFAAWCTQENLWLRTLDVAIAMRALGLPVYVLLEIVEWEFSLHLFENVCFDESNFTLQHCVQQLGTCGRATRVRLIEKIRNVCLTCESTNKSVRRFYFCCLCLTLLLMMQTKMKA